MTLDDEDLEEGSWQVVGEEDDSQVDSVGGLRTRTQSLITHGQLSAAGRVRAVLVAQHERRRLEDAGAHPRTYEGDAAGHLSVRVGHHGAAESTPSGADEVGAA